MYDVPRYDNAQFKGGKLALGICLALPELIVPVWNLLQIKVYEAPLVTGAAAVAAAIMHGIGPGVSEEVFCRGFTVSNLMRIWKDKPNRIFRCMLVSGVSFGLLHALNELDWDNESTVGSVLLMRRAKR